MSNQLDNAFTSVEKFSNFIEEPPGVLPPIQGFNDQPLVSLTDAVKPLKSLVPCIDHMVWTVKEDIRELHDDLSKDESASIRLYTLEWSGPERSFYKILNEDLRSRDRNKLKPWFLYLRLFVHALSKLPSNSHKIIYRGVQLDLSADYNVDETFFWWAFSSCTSSLDVLERFIDKTRPRTIFNITFHSAIDVTRHSYHAAEKEVLFYPARQFKVKSKINPADQLHIIQIEEIEPPFILFRIPNPIPTPTINQSINILLIGEAGVGKATLINAFVNYLSFKTLQEARMARLIVLKPLSFCLFMEDTCEERICTFGNSQLSDSSSTSHCQTYTFDLHLDDRTMLHFIDTPSLEDASQHNRSNTTIIQHILDYINQLSHLNAVCFLVRPDASRLSTTFQACFAQLMNRLGQNAYKNVIFCFTCARVAFYTPEGTASLLRNMFTSYSLNDIPFSRENTFFFDNESFRYLIAERNGITFTDGDAVIYTTSWAKSVKESNRLLNYIRRLSIHHIVKK